MRRFVVGALAPVLVVAAAGCGSSSTSSKSSAGSSSTPAASTAAAATPPPGAVAIGVRETEFKLTPGNISLKKSGKHTILAMNRGKVTHAIEVDGGGAGGRTCAARTSHRDSPPRSPSISSPARPTPGSVRSTGTGASA